jgi:hypothetical protein
MGYIYGIFRMLIVGQPSGVLVLAMISVSFMFRDLEVAKGVVRRLKDAGVDCVHADSSRIPEDELRGTLECYLSSSAHSIVVTSPGLPRRGGVAYEASFALALRHLWFVFGSSDDALPPALADRKRGT